MIRERRARTDERHVAAENIDELRQFVDARGADDLADAGDARVALAGIDAGAGVLRADGHAAKLQNFKNLAVLAEALLPEEHRAGRIELDGSGNQSHRNGADDQHRQRERAVKHALETIAVHLLSSPM